MANVRKRHTTEFKAKVAVEAIRQQKTTHELTAEYGIYATPINAWKKLALAAIPQAFASQKEQGRNRLSPYHMYLPWGLPGGNGLAILPHP